MALKESFEDVDLPCVKGCRCCHDNARLNKFGFFLNGDLAGGKSHYFEEEEEDTI